MFTAQDVMKLRAITGAGMMDCKVALKETEGNMDKAVELLREKGIAAAAKKQGRIAAEGVVGSYVHMNGSIGVLVEVNCETDFVAKSDKFLELVKNISMHIAANKPRYISVEEVPAEEVAKEKEILTAQAIAEGKPANVVEKMIEGRIKKYLAEICLMDQPYVKDGDKIISEVLNEAILTIGEKISIRRFTRYEMGEGLEKRQDDFAEEVRKQLEK